MMLPRGSDCFESTIGLRAAVDNTNRVFRRACCRPPVRCDIATCLAS
jgi:hypothetical protein